MAGDLMLECDHAARCEFLATDDKPYQFSESGLPNVYLVGVKYFICDCGEKFVEIPAIKQLFSLMARHTVMKREALTGAEIRFLRKRLGNKATEFAEKVKLTPETLSRVENDKQKIGKRSDNYIRIYYALASKDSVLLDTMKETLDTVLGEHKAPTKKPPRTVAKIEHDEWALAASAGT
jgi:transcriptional regulator with XRE-family HTH domain